MWKLLDSVINSFLLLRDIFGYLVPGAVFVGLMARSYHLSANLPSIVPSWFMVAIAIGFCYVVGQVLVSVGFTAYTWTDKILGKDPKQPADADLIYYRYVYPSLLVERDRRDVINVMRVGLGVGLTIAAWLFPFPLRITTLVVSLFVLWNGYTGRNHVFGYGVSTVEAGQRAEKNHVSYFRWDESRDKSGSDVKDVEAGTPRK